MTGDKTGPTVEVLDAMVAAARDASAKLVEVELNKLIDADPVAMHRLCETRVFCNVKVETDTLAVPYTPCETPPGEEPLRMLGLLGVLNAILHLHGLLLVAHYGDTPQRKNVLVRFEVKRKEVPRGDAEVEVQHGPELREAAPPAQDGGGGGPRRPDAG